MKKMVVFFIFIIFLITLAQLKDTSISFADCQKIVVISSNKYDELDENPIKNGGDYYHILMDSKKNDFVVNKTNYVYKGLVLYYDKTFNLEYFKDSFSFNFSNPSIIDDYKIYYGYCSYYKDFKIVDGKKINVQLVKNSEGWIVGLPMILTGF